MEIPTQIITILNLLEQYGYEEYLVGGCVRDTLLNKQPNDWDICTSALPEEAKVIFEKADMKVIPTGIKHGTVTVIFQSQTCEVTTYRIDKNYTDGRRPDSVSFTSSIEEDLGRRDFTMNAIAFHPRKGYIDPFQGIQAIHEKIIQSVGIAEKRFQEDALRMLRAVRFTSQLDFYLEEDTKEQIKQCSNLIQNISLERIRDELCKILISPAPAKGIRLLHETKLLGYILPELEACIGFNQCHPLHKQDVFEHILEVIKKTPAHLTLRLAALFHDIAKPLTFSLDEKGIGHFYQHERLGANMTKSIMRRLKFDSDRVSQVSRLVQEHMNRGNLKNSSIKRMVQRVGTENMSLLFKLMLADAHERHQENIFKLQKKAIEMIEAHEPMTLKDLCVKGKDLIELGIKPGPAIGQILNELLELVLEFPEKNKKERLIEYVSENHI